MSTITAIKFQFLNGTFPNPIGGTQTVDLKHPILEAWDGIAARTTLINGKTVDDVVGGAIRAQTKKTQQADSQLNSLVFGDTSQVVYAAKFTKPNAPGNAVPGAGVLEITLTIPGNSLAFTLFKSSNPTFDVEFSLIVRATLTFPLGIPSTAPAWKGGIKVEAEVEAFQVSTHNVGVVVCDPSAVSDVLNAINGQRIPLKGLEADALDTLNMGVEFAGQLGNTEVLQADDGNGTLVLTAVGPKLAINGVTDDTLEVAINSSGEVVATAHGKTGPVPGPISSITFYPGAGKNTIRVISLPPGAKVTVFNPQGAKDNVIVGGSAGLAPLNGCPVTVNDTSDGSTELTVDDAGDKDYRKVKLTAGAVNFESLSKVYYSGSISRLKVIGGSGGDDFFVQGTSQGTSTTIDAGTGKPAVYVGLYVDDPTHAGKSDGNLLQIAGPLDVTDQEGTGALVIDDSDPFPPMLSYKLYSDHVVFNLGPTINFEPAVTPAGKPTHGINSLTIYGTATKSNTIDVDGVGAETKVTLWGTSSDVVTGSAAKSVTHKDYAVVQSGPIPKIPQAGP